MKKILLLTIVITMLIAAEVVSANGPGIECTSTVQEKQVCISGRVPNVSQPHLVGLLVGDIDNIIYVDQTECDETGNFSFKFELPDSLPPGEYDVGVGTSADAETYHGTLVYAPTVERQFFDGNIILSVSNYIPTILGNVSCIDGKEISFNVVNSSDNTIIAQDTVTSEDGIYNLNYVLPSLITGKNYEVTISCKNETKNLFRVDVEINSSIILVSVNGDVQVADNVKLESNVQTTNSDLINKSATITSNESISTTIPNLVANMSCYVTLRGYESVIVDNNPEPDPEPNPDPDPDPDPKPDPDPDPLPDADEKFQTVESTYTVDGNANSLKRVLININNIPKLNNKIFKITYDASKLELVDGCGFTSGNETVAGAVSGTYIEIMSIANGQITFKINKEFSDNVVTSGAVNMLNFKKLTAGNTIITSKIEKAQ